MAGGLTPTLAADPPLRVIFYALPPAAHEPPQALRLLDARGRRLPRGAGFATPPTGALLAWDDAMDADALAYALTTQLRVLMGLDATLPAALTGRSDDQEAEVHPLEVLALHLNCARRRLREAHEELTALPSFVAEAVERGSDVASVHELAMNATRFMGNSVRLLARGDYAGACAKAVRAMAHAKAATRHPSLLPVELLPADYWLTTWPPLVFPIVSSVGAALLNVITAKRRRRARASSDLHKQE